MSGPLCLALLRMAQSLGLSLGCATRLRRLLDGCGSQAPSLPFAAGRWGRRQKYLECFKFRRAACGTVSRRNATLDGRLSEAHDVHTLWSATGVVTM